MEPKVTSHIGKQALRKAGTKGFTLIELVVVLVILAILAALLVPALTGYIDRARRQAALAECRSCAVAAQTMLVERYGKDKGATVTKADDGAEILKLADVAGDADTAFTNYVAGGFDVETGVLRHFCYHTGPYYVTYCSKGGCADCGKTETFTVSTTATYRNPFGVVADRNDTANTVLISNLAEALPQNADYNDKSSQADAIKATFMTYGVDLDALTGGTGTWTLHWSGETNQYNKVYWTTQDLSGSGQCYVMAFTLKTQNFTVWKANYKDGKITQETGSKPLEQDQSKQTYEQAMALYNKTVYG